VGRRPNARVSGDVIGGYDDASSDGAGAQRIALCRKTAEDRRPGMDSARSAPLACTINGRPMSFDAAEPGTTLLDFVRERGLTGAPRRAAPKGNAAPAPWPWSSRTSRGGPRIAWSTAA
jgi:hypothetical protein